jgi:hypothetical protein
LFLQDPAYAESKPADQFHEIPVPVEIAEFGPVGRVDEDASIVATTTVRASGPDLARRSVRPPRSGRGSPEPDSTKDRRAVRTVGRSTL